MATVNINHEGFQRRLDAIEATLQSYGLRSTEVIPVEYVEHVPFPYNNFIYKVELSEPITPSTFANKTRRPGTTAPPETGVSTLIIRLSNPYAEGLNNANRVENEVAAQYLFRQHLATSYPELAHLVPAVYAWEPYRYPDSTDETGFAWTMCEYMLGANLDAQFSEMELPDKLAVIERIADIFAAFQKTPLPPSLGGHLGGIKLDDNNQVLGAQMSILPPGPWQKYEDLWAARFQEQLHDAEKSSVLKGWADKGIRDRVDKAITADWVMKFLEGVDVTQRTLVHGDLTMNNMLFDKDTKQVSALLDFDWACVTHPAHEYFTGLWDLGGGTHPDDENLRIAVLSGNFGTADDSLTSENKIKWEVAKAWDSALAARGGIRPSSVQGIEKLDKLREFGDALCPFHLGSEVMIERIKRKTPEKLEESIKVATDKLFTLLEELGA